ncbi:MAG: hypothetical protein ACE5ID_03130 [Acidobacteriota bacterium]
MESMMRWKGGDGSAARHVRPARLKTLDGVIMLSPDGHPAGGTFPDNVWVVMGTDDDSIEDFFGPSADVLSAELETRPGQVRSRYCVGFDTRKQEVLMNGDGAYPVYVSGLLRLNRNRF